MARKPMLRVAGLWSKKDRNGNTFLSGPLGSLRILVFRNEDREEGQPDFLMYMAPADQPRKRPYEEEPAHQQKGIYEP